MYRKIVKQGEICKCNNKNFLTKKLKNYNECVVIIF